MSLLREIQDGAAEDSVTLGSLLRKTKLLAARIGVKQIGEWAERELSGYNNNDDLPPYRGPFETSVLSNAMVPYRGTFQNFPIPPLAVSEQIRDGFLFKLTFSQGVTELESLAATKETLRDAWPSDAVAMFHMLAKGGIARIDPSTTFIEIWKPIPYTTIVGVLDAIRTRLLDFTMQLEQEEPLAERGQRLPDPKHAASILSTIVYANTANVAVGNHDVTQTQTQDLPQPFDSDGLVNYLRGLGLGDELIEELEDALAEDAKEESEGDANDKPNGPGRRVLTWLKNVSTSATTQIVNPVTTSLVTAALLHYFHF